MRVLAASCGSRVRSGGLTGRVHGHDHRQLDLRGDGGGHLRHRRRCLDGVGNRIRDRSDRLRGGRDDRVLGLTLQSRPSCSPMRADTCRCRVLQVRLLGGTTKTASYQEVARGTGELDVCRTEVALTGELSGSVDGIKMPAIGRYQIDASALDRSGTIVETKRDAESGGALSDRVTDQASPRPRSTTVDESTGGARDRNRPRRALLMQPQRPRIGSDTFVRLAGGLRLDLPENDDHRTLRRTWRFSASVADRASIMPSAGELDRSLGTARVSPLKPLYRHAGCRQIDGVHASPSRPWPAFRTRRRLNASFMFNIRSTTDHGLQRR